MLNENPLKLNVGEYTMHVPDAPSSGPVLALILNIVDGEGAGLGQVGGVVLWFSQHPTLLHIAFLIGCDPARWVFSI